MPFPVDSEANTVEREAQSVAGSTLSQLMGIVRQFVNWIMAQVNKIIGWLGEHPEAALMGFANLYIMFT